MSEKLLKSRHIFFDIVAIFKFWNPWSCLLCIRSLSLHVFMVKISWFTNQNPSLSWTLLLFHTFHKQMVAFQCIWNKKNPVFYWTTIKKIMLSVLHLNEIRSTPAQLHVYNAKTLENMVATDEESQFHCDEKDYLYMFHPLDILFFCGRVYLWRGGT